MEITYRVPKPPKLLFSLFLSLCCCLLFLTANGKNCESADYVTAFGQSDELHAIDVSQFEAIIEESSGNIIAGGSLYNTTASPAQTYASFIYELDYGTCSVAFLVKLQNLNNGVRSLTLSPQDKNSLFALGSHFVQTSGDRQDFLIFADRRFYGSFALDGRIFKVSKFSLAIQNSGSLYPKLYPDPWQDSQKDGLYELIMIDEQSFATFSGSPYLQNNQYRSTMFSQWQLDSFCVTSGELRQRSTIYGTFQQLANIYLFSLEVRDNSQSGSPKILQKLQLPTNASVFPTAISALQISNGNEDQILLGHQSGLFQIDIFQINVSNGAFDFATSFAKTLGVLNYELTMIHQVENSSKAYFVITQISYSPRLLIYDSASDSIVDYDFIFTSLASSTLELAQFDSTINSVTFEGSQSDDLCVTRIVREELPTGTSSLFGQQGVVACSHSTRRLSSEPLLEPTGVQVNVLGIMFTQNQLQIQTLDSATPFLSQSNLVPLTSEPLPVQSSQSTSGSQQNQQIAVPTLVSFVTKWAVDDFIDSPRDATIYLDEPPVFQTNSVVVQNVTIGSELRWTVFFQDESPTEVIPQLQIEGHPEISLFYEGPNADPDTANAGLFILRSEPIPVLSSREKHYISLKLTDTNGLSNFYPRAIELRFYDQETLDKLNKLYLDQSQALQAKSGSNFNNQDTYYSTEQYTYDNGSYNNDNDSQLFGKNDQDDDTEEDSSQFKGFQGDESFENDGSKERDFDDQTPSDEEEYGNRNGSNERYFDDSSPRNEEEEYGNRNELQGDSESDDKGFNNENDRGDTGFDDEDTGQENRVGDMYDETIQQDGSTIYDDNIMSDTMSTKMNSNSQDSSQTTNVDVVGQSPQESGGQIKIGTVPEYQFTKKEIDMKWKAEIEKMMVEYRTSERLLQAYGGPVSTKRPQMDAFGRFTTTFSRNIYFPKELLAKYAPEQYLRKPQVPTDSLMRQWESDFYENFRGKYDPNGGRKRNLQSKNQIKDEEQWTGQADLARSIEDRITFEIEIESENKHLLAKMQQFTFNITKLSHTMIEIEFNFENPSLFGSRTGSEILIGKADFADFEPSWNSEEIFFKKRIVKQTDRSSQNLQLASQLDNLGQGSQTAAVASIASNFLLSSCMAQIWGMINGIQLLVHLPILAVDFPIFSQIFIDQLITIATFDLVDTDSMFDNLFDIATDPEEHIPPQFYNSGYQSNFLIKDLGLSWIVLAFGIVFCILTPLILLLCKCQKVQNKFIGWRSSMYFGFYLRYLLETFIEVLICVYIDYQTRKKKVEKSDKSVLESDLAENSGYFSLFSWINGIFMILFCASIALLPFFILTFYLFKFKKWQDEVFEKRFGAILENLVLTKASSIFYPFFFLVRRIGMLYVALFDHKRVFVQVIYQLVTVMIQLVYLFHFRPYLDKQALKLDIFNEITTLGLSYFILCFSSANPVEGGTQNFDWLFIVILGGNIATHLIIIIFGQVIVTKVKCKRGYEMRKLRRERAQERDQKMKMHPINEESENNLSQNFDNTVLKENILSDILEDSNSDQQLSNKSEQKLLINTGGNLDKNDVIRGANQPKQCFTEREKTDPQNLPWIQESADKNEKIIQSHRASIGSAFLNVEERMNERFNQIKTGRELAQIEEITEIKNEQ